jgi:predicted metal-dependent phosphoesterase TrpH
MSAARGLVHVHSSYSFDSETPLREVKALARAKGCAFVIQTEHSNEMTAASHRSYLEEARGLADDGFVMVPGVEYASSDNKIHVLVLGVDTFWEDLRLCPPERLAELLSRVRGSGGLSILAHPERADAIDRLSPGVLALIDGIEVWNGKTDKLGPSPRGVLEAMRRRRRGERVLALAGLDLHRLGDHFPVGIETERSPKGEPDLLAMLREARFRIYAGPIRWDASRCGSPAQTFGRASKAAIDAARAVKRGLLRFRA